MAQTTPGYFAQLEASRYLISPSRLRAWAMSQLFCICMSVSIETPKAFSMRSAISDERCACKFTPYTLHTPKPTAEPDRPPSCPPTLYGLSVRQRTEWLRQVSYY